MYIWLVMARGIQGRGPLPLLLSSSMEYKKGFEGNLDRKPDTTGSFYYKKVDTTTGPCFNRKSTE